MQLTGPTAAHPQARGGSLPRIRLFGLLMIAVGIAGWWYNHHLAATAGEFYTKLCLIGPLGLFGGLLVMARPEWAGPLRNDSSRDHKAALIAVVALMAVGSGVDFYLLKHVHSLKSPVPGLPAATLFVRTAMAAPAITLLGQTYRLGSFNLTVNPTWEFVAAGESTDGWKTLLTVIDRPDARNREELDRLAEGILATYKSHGGKILAARTMRRDSGEVFNYMVAAFEQPEKQRYELNFAKLAMAGTNAVVMVYGVRVTDPQDYRAKAKKFLDRQSSEVGHALGQLEPPDIRSLPPGR